MWLGACDVSVCVLISAFIYPPVRFLAISNGLFVGCDGTMRLWLHVLRCMCLQDLLLLES